MLPPFDYARPDSLRDAIAELADEGARLHAGGSDLLGCLHDGVFGAEKVVSLSRVEGLDGIRETDGGGLALGALVRVSEVAADRRVGERYPGLAQAAAAVGSPQLRHQGTIGGNLCQRPRCWYFRGDFHCAKKGGDTCFAAEGENRYHAIFGGGLCYIVHPSDTAPALLALGAELEIAGPDGRRRVPIADFYQLPEENLAGETVLADDEIVTEVRLPPADGVESSYRKVRERGAWDFALTSLAVALTRGGDGTVEEASLVLGGVAPVPWPVPAAAEVIRGRPITAASARAAAEAAVEGAEPLAQNAYKVELVRGVVEEELGRLAA